MMVGVGAKHEGEGRSNTEEDGIVPSVLSRWGIREKEKWEGRAPSQSGKGGGAGERRKQQAQHTAADMKKVFAIDK